MDSVGIPVTYFEQFIPLYLTIEAVDNLNTELIMGDRGISITVRKDPETTGQNPA